MCACTCVCSVSCQFGVSLEPLEPLCGAVSMLRNKTKPGSNVPPDHPCCLINYRLPGLEIRQCEAVPGPGLRNSVCHEPVPLDSMDKTSGPTPACPTPLGIATGHITGRATHVLFLPQNTALVTAVHFSCYFSLFWTDIKTPCEK